MTTWILISCPLLSRQSRGPHHTLLRNHCLELKAHYLTAISKNTASLPHPRSKENIPSHIASAPTTPSTLLPPTLHIPLSTRGRPRAASRALNQANNAAKTPSVTSLPNATATAVSTRYTLHDKPCDGESVTEPHVTLHAHMRADPGLQQVPMIQCADGRVIVDWIALRDEETKRMGEQK